MKIGIDLKAFFSGSKYRGIGTYSRKLIEEILKNTENMNFEYHFFNLYGKYEGDPAINKNSFLHNYYSGPKNIFKDRVFFDTEKTIDIIEKEVRHFIGKSNIDVMLFTSPNEYGNFQKIEWYKDVFTVGVLHDLIPMIFPEQCLFDLRYKENYEKTLEFLKGLDLILANSEATKKDAINLLGIEEEKIVVIHAGISSKFKKLEKIEVKKIKEKYNITDPFILFAGGIDFKKNIEGVLEAFSMLPSKFKDKYQLVVVGKIDDNTKKYFLNISEKYKILSKVVYTNFISEEDLIQLYNIAELLIFPSLYEGFGFPVLEAMACGTKVLTSNNSSLVEIAKGYATLVDPTSAKKIKKGIQEILDNPLDKLELAEKSIDYAKSYTWKKVAIKTLNAINEKFILKRKIKYKNLEVTEEILENISELFVKNKLEFSKKEIKKISDILFKLQNNENINLINGKNKILYDMTVVHEWLKNNYSTGIGRVCKELFFALGEKNIVLPVFVTLNEEKEIEFKIISMDDYSITKEKVHLEKNDIFFMPEFQIRGVQVSKEHPYVKKLREKGYNCYAVIYDILPLKFPQYFEDKTATEFKNYIDEIFENYNGILTDSRAVADEIVDFYKNNYKYKLNHEIKIGYFHLGQDTFEEKKEIIGYEISQFMDTKDSIYLMVGTIEPRKGHTIVFETFIKMWEDGFNGKLCIIGHIGWKMEEFINKMKKHKEFGRKLLFIEGAADSEVSYAYKNSSALIQASAGEGFGLPLIEAGYYNLPIICSDIPIFHEVSNENAIFFKRNEEDLKNKIIFFEENKNTEKIPNSKNIKSLTWNEVSDRVYSMIIEDKNWYVNIKRDGEIEKY